MYALYLHTPFCRHRCSYCDFNTYTTLGDLQEPYVAALVREIEQVGAAAPVGMTGGRAAIPTIFFGGGTPSLLTPGQVERILAAAHAAFEVAPDAEITMEANPETVDREYLAAVRALGVNRLSFGVQSADARELALLGREHDFATAVRVVELARDAGFDNVNIDLIYGLPGQSVDDWRRTLDAVLPLTGDGGGVSHISLYCLTIEPGTPMQRWLHNGSIHAPDPDTAADQYELACEVMAGAGFVHYEISNWARPGRECRHNLVYWRDEPYLGLGAGAHGMAGGYRYQIVRQPRAYIRRMNDAEPATPDSTLDTLHSSLVTRNSSLPTAFPLSSAVAAHHAVDDDEAMSDMAITQLRLLNEGLDLDGFAARFGRTFDDVHGDALRELTAWGLLRREGGRLLLTDKGRFLSNQVFYRFV